MLDAEKSTYPLANTTVILQEAQRVLSAVVSAEGGVEEEVETPVLPSLLCDILEKTSAAGRGEMGRQTTLAADIHWEITITLSGIEDDDASGVAI